jgi:hypothetical protein
MVLKTFSNKCLVKYDEFVSENDNSKHLCGMVQISQLRLVPPDINNMSWVENDVIEIYESNCWWVGKTIRYLPCETKYVVYFFEIQKKCKLMHHVYDLVKIGCIQTMHVILLGNYTLFTWYVFYFIQVFFSFFLKFGFHHI